MQTKLFKSKLTLVSPALLNKEFIPVYTNIIFNNGIASAYNGTLGISTSCELPVVGGVKGRTLLSLINSMESDSIDFIQSDSGLVIKSGRSKFNLSVDPEVKFREWSMPDLQGLVHVADMTAAFFSAMEYATLSAGTNPSYQERMGVTIKFNTEAMTLYSTDNASVSSVTVTKCGGTPTSFIAPKPFCDAVVSIAKDYGMGGLYISPSNDFVVADFGDVRVYSSLPSVEALSDYQLIIDKHMDEVEGKLVGIPLELPGVLNRSKAMGGDYARCQISIYANATVFSTESKLGTVEDTIPILIPLPDGDFKVDVSLLSRVLGYTSSIGFSSTSTVMVGSQTIGDSTLSIKYLAAHSSGG